MYFNKSVDLSSMSASYGTHSKELSSACGKADTGLEFRWVGGSDDEMLFILP